jgi:alpha-glucosidase/alpha-D-xyloside xylohydrolase
MLPPIVTPRARTAGRRRARLVLPAALPAALLALAGASLEAQIVRGGEPVQLDVRAAGERSVRVTLKPVAFESDVPFSPTLAADRTPSDPVLSLRELDAPVEERVGDLVVSVRPDPLTVSVANAAGELVQELVFENDGRVSFALGDQPVLGMGEGGPQPGEDWRTDHEIEFDRRGRFHEMRPRWQSNAYGSRNPVALLIGTGGWGIYVATPWVQVDLEDEERGVFIPWERPEPPAAEEERRRWVREVQGRPPASQPTDVFDAFVFDARDPAVFMKDVSTISGPAVMPPRWALGYMQSHRELIDAELDSEDLLLHVVDTFREKRIPLDAVIYLGTGFTPTGWNTPQPSFDFNPEVFERDPAEVLADLHERDVRVIVHIVPWERERLRTLHGTIPREPDETRDESHIESYWQEHVDLVRAGIDAWWPDEGDWFDLFERIKRHQLYYQGPLSTTPNVRPWSLHRNGHLGVAQWGGWVWSGDTNATWKTLEGQIAVGINHSLSLGPYWGSDTGGFYTTSELTGELYARWFQFSAFTPSFRSHGRIWRLRVPWGWGLSDMGFLEGQEDPPLESEMNNPAIEPVARKYAELRYQLIPYTYTLARQARDEGMPLMRALWLHYPGDERARGRKTEYLWGRDLLVAPVFTPGATEREVYLPAGDDWYDWWSNERHAGGRTVTRPVDLETMPIYARAGAIIPFDPVRQHMDQEVDEPTTLKVFGGADGELTLYEDDGISLAYLEGRGSWTRMTWDDGARTLTLEPDPPEGATNEPSGPRTFVVELLPGGERRTVRYDGARTSVPF